MAFIKNNVFCFLHGIYNFDFLSFCKFPFGANLEAAEHVHIPNSCINSFNMMQNNEPFNSCLNNYIFCMFYALCEVIKNKYFSIKLVFRLIFHKNQHFFASLKKWKKPPKSPQLEL